MNKLTEFTGHLLDPEKVDALDVLGATIRYLTPPEGDDLQPCLMYGTLPPGVIVPLHSHPDPETFLVRAGRLEVLTQAPVGFQWTLVGPGEIFHVPGNAKHAWRNLSRHPAATIIVTTVKLGRFFGELGGPVGSNGRTSWPPTGRAIERLLQTAERYGYWNATPEENDALGLGSTDRPAD